MATRIKKFCSLVLLCLAMICSPVLAVAQDHGTAEEAQAMVARAIAMFDEVGADATMNAISHDPAPDFLDGDL